MKKVKKLLSFALAIVMAFTILPMATVESNASTNHTLAEAINWIKARGNENWWRDVDGAYGCQCVDLIMAYYEYLVGYRVSGNAKDYLNSSKLPSGWWMDSTPSEGAIIVWGANTWTGQWTTDSNGHVGLVYSVSGSNVYTVETNTGSTNGQGDAASAKFRTRVNCNAKYIHPDFSSAYIKPPVAPTVSLNKTFIKVNEPFTLSWTQCENADRYWISCWSDTAHVISKEGYNFSESIIVDTPGNYSITVVSINNSGETIGNWIPFTVFDNFNGYNTFQYNANGGNGEMSEKKVYYDTIFSLDRSTFQRLGYTQTGWNAFRVSDSKWHVPNVGWNTEEKIKENNWIKSIYPNPIEDWKYDYSWYEGGVLNDTIVLYAIWETNNYTVKYNANGGTGTTANSNHTYDTAKALTVNGFKRTGYTFLGWSTNASATSATYTDKQSVNNLTAVNGDTVTLYAVWQKNPATVSKISVQSKPAKTAYAVGDTFNSSGISLTVNYSDGTSKTVTDGFTVTAPDMSTAGTKTVNITYNGVSASYEIKVLDVVLGDLNGNGRVNTADYAMLAGYVTCNIKNLSDEEFLSADIDKDGTVDAFDVIMLDLYLNDIIDL